MESPVRNTSLWFSLLLSHELTNLQHLLDVFLSGDWEISIISTYYFVPMRFLKAYFMDKYGRMICH